jgi:hypothetical protein
VQILPPATTTDLSVMPQDDLAAPGPHHASPHHRAKIAPATANTVLRYFLTEHMPSFVARPSRTQTSRFTAGLFSLVSLLCGNQVYLISEGEVKEYRSTTLTPISPVEPREDRMGRKNHLEIQVNSLYISPH